MTRSDPVSPTLSERIRAAGERLGDRLEAEVLASLAVSRPRRWLYAHGDVHLTSEEAARLDALLQRRLAGTPIAYLEGVREFYGREFRVDPRVLIPRPETEHLVDFALHLRLPDQASVADIGTGSGCIVLTLACERPGWSCVGCDLSEDALAVAAINRAALGLERVELVAGDLLQPIAGRAFDLIVSNPPYVAADDPHLDRGDLVFEPRIALTPGDDGLAILRRLAQESPAHLRPGGWLAVEHGHDQAAAVQELFRQAGFEQVASIPDLAGIARITIGQRRAKSA